MSANSIITDNFRYRIIKNLEESFSSTARSLYFFYARPSPYNTINDQIPQLQISNLEENYTKSNIISLKKINDKDLILAIDRYNWQSGEIYDAYTDKESLVGKKYYTITDAHHVYKCLDNNSVSGNPSQSTAQPTGTSVDPIRTIDGYLWRYMYTLTDGIRNKFNVSNFMPVDLSDGETQLAILRATPGTCNRINIKNNLFGEGYTLFNHLGEKLPYIPLYILGNGNEVKTGEVRVLDVNENGTIRIDLSTPISGLSGFTITNNGSNYAYSNGNWIPIQLRPKTVGLNSSDVTYAYGIAQVNANNGNSIQRIRLLSGGTGYQVNQTVEIVQSSAIGYAYINNEINSIGDIKMAEILVNHQGENFTFAEVIQLRDNVIEECDMEVVISPLNGHGSNPEQELGSTNLLFNIKIAYEEFGGAFSTSNDFRTIGLIEKVKYQDSFGENQIFSQKLTLSGATSLILEENVDETDYPLDRVIVGNTSGARGVLLDIINGNTLRLIRNIENSNNIPFLPNENVSLENSTASSKIIEIKLPEYVPNSGNLLFINNREPIQRSESQIETINFIIRL